MSVRKDNSKSSHSQEQQSLQMQKQALSFLQVFSFTDVSVCTSPKGKGGMYSWAVQPVAWQLSHSSDEDLSTVRSEAENQEPPDRLSVVKVSDIISSYVSCCFWRLTNLTGQHKGQHNYTRGTLNLIPLQIPVQDCEWAGRKARTNPLMKTVVATCRSHIIWQNCFCHRNSFSFSKFFLLLT